MSKKIEMIGKKFNKLTVLEEVGVNKRNQRLFRCSCDCGNECIAEGYEIRSSRKKSCGCIKNEEKVENRKNQIIGKKFGRLLVIREMGGKGVNTLFECLCDCGSTCIKTWTAISVSGTQSCGCLTKERVIKRETTHGGSKERLFVIWSAIKARCYRKNCKEYKHYGAKGVIMCEEWRSNYASFREFMLNNGYDPKAPRGKCTIERIDVNGNYCPENCKVITIQEQAFNRTDSHFVTYKGVTKTLTEWAREYGKTFNQIHHRLERGWSIEDALNKPIKRPKVYEMNGEEHTLKEWSEIIEIPWSTLRTKIRNGLTLEEVAEERGYIPD